MNEKLITRIAPSPTGNFHIGTARTAYFNWLAAKASGGQFLLRIDDTDADRSKAEDVQQIHDALEWLGLVPDQVFVQSERTANYQAAAQQLIETDLAYKDQDDVVRFQPQDIPEKWHDEVSGDVIISDNDQEHIRGLALLRSDGSPLYHFASVVDDVDMGVNFIIRGVDHITNTSRQVPLFLALSGKIPKFAHVGLIRKDGKKMSKRDDAASLLSYRDEYDPDAILNFLLRMGWGPRVDDKTTKVIWRDRAIKLFFDGGKMRSADSNFDQSKLDSYNRKFIARKKQARGERT